tara:strand:+ start:15489 stop:16400 length:912 start_codon:yes stop_codon:yes gene_type:complete
MIDDLSTPNDTCERDSEPQLSVILCTLNGGGTIGDQLEALLAQNTVHPFEVLVVDNGSTDDTVDRVSAFAAKDNRVRIESAPDRHNLSYARNVGVSCAHAPTVAFCDDDDLVGPNWVEGLLKALQTSPYVASSMEYEKLNSANRMVGRARFQSEQIAELFGIPVTNGAIAIEQDLWTSLGGNDESFGTTGEDFDFSMRVFEQTGLAPVLATDAIYHYRLRSGGRSTFRQARRYGQSHPQLYKRHGRGRVDIKDNTIDAFRDWWWIITRAPTTLSRDRRENWMTHAGRRIGRVLGSFKYRVLLL